MHIVLNFLFLFIWFFIIIVVSNDKYCGNIYLKYLIILYFYLFIIIFSTDFVSVTGAPGVYGMRGTLQSEPLPFGLSQDPLTCCCNTIVNCINCHCFLPMSL